MNTRYAVLAVALTALAAAGGAQAQLSVTHDPAQVKPGHYVVEPNHTRVRFAVSHLEFTVYSGDFTGVKGTLDLTPAAVSTSRLTISIPTASVSTTNPTLDGELRGADWLDAAKDPAIGFVSTAVELTAPGRARISGDLTLHGVTRPVTLDAKFNAAGVNPLDRRYTAGFDATAHIRRSDFGVSKYVPLVGDDVEITISAAFEKTD